MHRRLLIRLILGVAALFGLESGALAWTPATQAVIAREAAHLSPPDLARQIEKHRRELEAGVGAPFADSDAARHMKNPDGSGSLDRVIEAEAAKAVAMIQG